VSSALRGTSLSEGDVREIANALGETSTRDYGYTCSDIMQQFAPSLVLAAYPSAKITIGLALSIASSIAPTPPFKSE